METISHSIKKGLSFKPSFAFLFPLVKRLLIQLKNFVIMAIGLNDDKIFASGGQDCRAEFRLDNNYLEKQENGMLTS